LINEKHEYIAHSPIKKMNRYDLLDSYTMHTQLKKEAEEAQNADELPEEMVEEEPEEEVEGGEPTVMDVSVDA